MPYRIGKGSKIYRVKGTRKAKRKGRRTFSSKDKAKKFRNRQRGKSNSTADRKRKAKRPGRRVSKAGNVYYERRKNRSDKPGRRT